MICGLWKGKEKGSLHTRVLQSTKRQSKGSSIFRHSQGRRGRTLLRAHIPRNHCRACVELAEYQFPLHLSYLLYYMFEAHYIYIYIHLKLVFPKGVLSRVMLTKNTCVHFMYVRV
jgi:hypothetical protein